MSILILGAHATSGRSMHRYTKLLEQGWRDAGHEVRVLTPTNVLSRRVQRRAIRKWLGYVEKFILFVPVMRIASRRAEQVHIADHSDAVWALELARDVTTVTTVHDLFAVRAALGHIAEHRIGITGRIYQSLVRRGLGRSRHLVADSKSTQADIRAVLGREAALVYVPLDPYFAASNHAGTTVGNHLLVVAGTDWRKRRHQSIAVWRELRRTQLFQGCTLIVVGEGLNETERDAAGPDLSAIEVRTDADDHTLCDLYRSARAVLIMSQYEGFGWPVIEAQAFGRPVLCSDIPVFRDIAGTGAVFLADGTNHDWSHVAAALQDPKLDDLSRHNVLRYSWKGFVEALTLNRVPRPLSLRVPISPAG